MNMSRRRITSKELDLYLYGRTDVLPVKLEGGSPEEERKKQQIIAKIPNHEGTHASCSCAKHVNL